MSEVEAKALVSKVDKDGSKGVDFTEFAQLWEALHGEAEVYTDTDSTIIISLGWNWLIKAEFREKFAKLDLDNSGFITKEELLEVVVVSGETGTKADEAKATIDLLDVDKDGKVSYPEFLLVMKFKK